MFYTVYKHLTYYLKSYFLSHFVALIFIYVVPISSVMSDYGCLWVFYGVLFLWYFVALFLLFFVSISLMVLL